MKIKLRYIIAVLLLIYLFGVSFLGGVVSEKYNHIIGVLIFAFATLTTYFMGIWVWDMVKKADKKE